MSEDKQVSPSLQNGFMLGNQAVQHFIATEVLGDRYAVLFGSTNRVYDVNISSGVEARCRLADYEALLARVSALRHPCLIPYFACGEDDGVAWIRSEHSDGVPDWVITSTSPIPVRHADDSLDADEHEIRFATLRTLLAATNGKLSNADRNTIIGDIAEAMAYLHSNGLPIGNLSPETVFLDKTFRNSGLIARLRFYAGPEVTRPEQMVDDLRQAGDLLLLLLAASDKTKKIKLYQALLELATTLKTSGVFASGAEFYGELCAIFEDHGEFHNPRTEKRSLSDAADGSVLDPLVTPPNNPPSVAGSVRRHRSGRHRHKAGKKSHRFDSNSATGSIIAAGFRIGLMFAGIVGVGLAVYFGMKHIDNQRRANTLITSAQRYSAISIIEDESEKVDMGAFPESVLNYTPEQLKIASGKGDAVATARLAILTLEENPADPNLKVEADAILAPLMSRLEVEALSNPVSAYWYGYVRLLGICSVPDSVEAMSYLRRALENGYADASILLGDWLANRNPEGDAEDDRQAMQRWRSAFGVPEKWTRTQMDAITRIIAFVRQQRGFKNDDAELAKLLTQAATEGHLDAMMLVSELHDSGKLLEESSSTALSWLRRVTSNGATPDVMRAEAQRRMAGMFADGRGTPASLSAARIWYERAAKLGNKKAMLTLAEFCESGKGAENGKRNDEEGRYWRDKAASVIEPPQERIFRLLPSSAPQGRVEPAVESATTLDTPSEPAPKEGEAETLD